MILAVQFTFAQDLADLFETNKYSVVTIYTEEDMNSGTGDPRTFTSNMGLGSGVLIRDNYITYRRSCDSKCKSNHGGILRGREDSCSNIPDF